MSTRTGAFNDFAEIASYLDGKGLFRMVPGLDRIITTVTRLGLKHPPFPIIQVVGTNGKGSTTTMLAQLAKEHGFTVGTHTSPHFVSPKERIRINNTMLSDELWLQCANMLTSAEGDALSYFEYLTALALLMFSVQKVDIAIMETGLGGTWDATTALAADLVVFTPIHMDHTDVLGSTLAAIAADKAGAIRPNTPCISIIQPTEVWSQLSTAAKKLQAPCISVAEAGAPRIPTEQAKCCIQISLPLRNNELETPACHTHHTAGKHAHPQAPVQQSTEIQKHTLLENKKEHHHHPSPPKPAATCLSLEGAHQKGNAAIALGAWRYAQHLLNKLPAPTTAEQLLAICTTQNISPKEERALGSAWLSGRMQRTPFWQKNLLMPPATTLSESEKIIGNEQATPLLDQTQPNSTLCWPPLILDGAHNAHALAALGHTLAQQRIAPLAVIFSCLRDKDIPSMISHVRAFSTGAIFVPPIANNPRAMPPQELAALLGLSAYPTSSLQEALYLAAMHMRERMPEVFEESASCTHPLLICGSLYLLGEVYALRPDLLQSPVTQA